MLRLASWAARCACASTVFATTRRPLVSLSRRCTIPARGTAARLGAAAIEGDVPALEPRLQAVTRVLREKARQRLVKAHAAELARHRRLHRRGEALLPVGLLGDAII